LNSINIKHERLNSKFEIISNNEIRKKKPHPAPKALPSPKGRVMINRLSYPSPSGRGNSLKASGVGLKSETISKKRNSKKEINVIFGIQRPCRWGVDTVNALRRKESNSFNLIN